MVATRNTDLNDAAELAHADRTALPKTDTNYTALSLTPTIIGNTFAASLRTDICPQWKESSSTSHARNPFNLNFFDSAQCLMVRRWRLIGYFPILYNPAWECRAERTRSSGSRHCGCGAAHSERVATRRASCNTVWAVWAVAESGCAEHGGAPAVVPANCMHRTACTAGTSRCCSRAR
jgi:hypothetical protein